MRQKLDHQSYLPLSPESTAKVVRQYEKKYHLINDLLVSVPELLTLVDRDLKKLNRHGRRGRKATYTSDILLRVLIVHHLENGSLRDTEILLTHNVFLQDFVRLGPHRPVPSYSFLDRCLNAVRPETWARVNEVLTKHAFEQDLIDPSEIRTDTTLVETNIHYPTDTSLLWDCFRTLLLLFSHAREIVPGLIPYRFHERKAKKYHLFITRYVSSPCKKRQRKVKKAQVRLLEQVERITMVATEFAEAAEHIPDAMLQAIIDKIRQYVPLAMQVIHVAERVWIRGEKVPACDRIFSLFEPHTELIKRGRRHKPVEFGHMICLGQTRSRFITQYDVMEKKVPDCFLPEKIVEKHTTMFGAPPEILVADKGFCGKQDAMKALREKVKVVAIPQRLKDYADDEFVLLQHFRAGIEGSISALKRAFGLLRCQYRGFKNFAAHVGLGVFCYNLVNLVTSSP